MLDKTSIFSSKEVERAVINEVLKEVYDALKERGYNPINQFVGYLVSGDPGYISSYKNARSKILSLERTEILVALLEGYLEI